LESINFVQSMFQNYYVNGLSLLENVTLIEKREFGFASFDGFMLRHKSFGNLEELMSFLRNFAPKDAYFSCAFYEHPEAEMDKKGWLGADLIFDIDADHIPTSCSKIHDQWVCGNCGFTGKGIVPDKCPVCRSEKFETSTWPCEICLESAKEETIKLVDMLLQDFGFSEEEIRIFFSGHRGYHIHIEDDSIKKLDAVARKEIVDYVLGLNIHILQSNKESKKIEGSPMNSLLGLQDIGWAGRIAKSVYDFILEAEKEKLVNIGVRKDIAEAILKNRNVILNSFKESKTFGSIKGLGPETWRKIIAHCVEKQTAKIDTVVTMDVHRLIRIPETLHGKTGFKKVEFSISDIESFDPFKNAIAFKRGEITVLVSDAPKFRIGEDVYGPYKNCKVELPTAAALLLVCKGKAEVVN